MFNTCNGIAGIAIRNGIAHKQGVLECMIFTNEKQEKTEDNTVTNTANQKNYDFPPISVFCGASNHAAERPENAGHIESISNFGRILAENNIGLVWGAGETGSMGAVSRATLDAGGQAIGVSTHHLLYGREGCQLGVTLLLVADDMQARKLAFAKLSCAFAVFPGGAGTSDELYEYLIEREYGEHTKPLILVNLGGYFDHLLKDMKQAIASGDISDRLAELILVVDNENEVLPRLAEYFKQFPNQEDVPRDLEPDSIRDGFGQHLHLGPPGPDGARTVTLTDTMIPLEMVGPQKLARAVAVWAGGLDDALDNDSYKGLKEELLTLVDKLGESAYRIVHSGQSTGFKGVITKQVNEKDYKTRAVATEFMKQNKMVDLDQKNLLIRRNEQSLDFTLKALSRLFIICPGGADVREKLFEFLTEVDIKEHDKPLILWNYNGCFDQLLIWLDHLYERGYMNERALNKVSVLTTADEIFDLVEKKLAEEF